MWIDESARIEHSAVMHVIREKQSLAMHRRIAAMLIERPDTVIAKALDNLRRWTTDTSAAEVAAVYLEWRNLLMEKTSEEIAEIIVSEDENAVRLRQSSPFAGVLNAREVWKIKRSHEAA